MALLTDTLCSLFESWLCSLIICAYSFHHLLQCSHSVRSLYSIWPARQSIPGTNVTAPVIGRGAGAQAGYQVVALIVTLIVSLVGGAITGM